MHRTSNVYVTIQESIMCFTFSQMFKILIKFSMTSTTGIMEFFETILAVII